MGEEVTDSMTAFSRVFRFMASFDVHGMMHTWGCSFDIEIRVVQQVQKKLKAGTVTNNTMIDFKFEDWAPRRYRTADPGSLFFPSDATQLTMSRKFGDVKSFLRRRLIQSYTYQFAVTSPVLMAVGALPGTEGDDEKSGFHMMQVCAKRDSLQCPNGFAEVFDFYDKHLGVKVDSRGYGIFDAATVQKIAADLTADVP
jgi:hypothetical protein